MVSLQSFHDRLLSVADSDSDSSTEDRLELASLRASPLDGALLCTVKRDLCPDGLVARFTHAAHAELMNAVEERAGTYGVRLAGLWTELPPIG